MFSVWRLHLKSAAESVDPGAFCIKKGVLGIGWAVEPDRDDLDWDTYQSRGMEQFCNEGVNGWWPAINALRNRMQIGDLCWTRTRTGKYWLGRISGEWKYCNLPAFRQADILNLRSAKLHEVGNLQDVPGAVVNAFRRGRTLQRIQDDGVELYSKFLFNALAREALYDLTFTDVDLFALLSPNECEDIVGIYLQTAEGAVVLPSTCKNDTKDFEFVLKRKNTGAYIAVQVKQGGEPININAPEYSTFDGDVYLFQTRNFYEGRARNNVTLLKPDDMKRFCLEHLNLMPANVQRWVAVSKQLAQRTVAKGAVACSTAQ